MGSKAGVFGSKFHTLDLVQVFGGPRRSTSCPQNPITIVPSHIIMFGHSYDISYHFLYPLIALPLMVRDLWHLMLRAIWSLRSFYFLWCCFGGRISGSLLLIHLLSLDNPDPNPFTSSFSQSFYFLFFSTSLHVEGSLCNSRSGRGNN